MLNHVRHLRKARALGPLSTIAALGLLWFGAISAAATGSSGCTLDRTELQPEAAIAPCTTLLESATLSDHERASALFVRGRAYHRTKRLDLALRDYDSALKLAPNDEEILLSRSNLFLRQGYWRRYVADVERATQINPSNPHVLTAAGTLYRNSGNLPMALEYYSRAIAAPPKDAFAFLSRMEVYRLLHDFPHATADADAAVRLTAEAAQTKPLGYLDEDGNVRDFLVVALTKRAGVLEDAGQLQRSQQDYNAAVARDTSGLALLRRGEFYMNAPGRQDAAIADLHESLRREPDNAGASYTLGLVLIEQKKYAEALEAFDRALAARPRFGYALFMRAKMHRQFGRTDDAVNDLMHAIAVDGRVLPLTLPAMRRAGYWTSQDVPDHMSPELADAIRACMIDVQCN
ncbi:MAG TPA: tetratricopeptide repeat protein [Pseudolabrys sp.]|nr:tetratricopeptide repeat protein [Pseudolabrys sp.]